METTRSLGLGRLLTPLCCGAFLFVLLLLEGSVFFQACAIDVELKDTDNVTCLYAKWRMNFSIKYESDVNEYKSKAFMLPSNVSFDGSTCGKESKEPQLAIGFGRGHFWTINFIRTADTYQGNISFTYNTNDTQLFPDAKRKGSITTSVKYPHHPVKLNTFFSCSHMDSVEAGNVTQAFWNVTLQAFVQNGSMSTEQTQCDKDNLSTTSASTLTTTKATAPTTPAMLSPAHVPTAKPGDKPVTGNYSLQSGTTTCLLASMGLQLNISLGKAFWVVNVHPETTVATGSCGNTTAVLTLKDDRTGVISFLFTASNKNSPRFHLNAVNVSIVNPSNVTIYAGNSNLSYWDASMGNSYMCQQKQTIVLTPAYHINTFALRVQPFRVKDNTYSAAQECLLDDDTVLIPIVVGAALGGLIVVIVIAYIIGRRRSYAGYQTL